MGRKISGNVERVGSPITLVRGHVLVLAKTSDYHLVRLAEDFIENGRFTSAQVICHNQSVALLRSDLGKGYSTYIICRQMNPSQLIFHIPWLVLSCHDRVQDSPVI